MDNHTWQDSNSKIKTKQTKTQDPTTLQKTVPSKFPRQLLEVGISFYRKLSFFKTKQLLYFHKESRKKSLEYKRLQTAHKVLQLAHVMQTGKKMARD